MSKAIKPNDMGDCYRPELLSLNVPENAQRYLELRRSNAAPLVKDELKSQLNELMRTEHIGQKLSEAQLNSLSRDRLAEMQMEEYGTWVYFPWIHQLIHILPENEFVELRTNRNRNKITQDEQTLLSAKRIGVVGLSVGRSVAVTMAQERVAGEIRLADFDEIELSNLNRIRCGLNELGVNKAVSAAREIALIDPYIKVQVFQKGLTDENMDSFFLEGGKLDLFIEECDEVRVKVTSRLKARELGIPVVMDTSDRGMIDVERFDLEPKRELFHGVCSTFSMPELESAKTNAQKFRFFAPIIDMHGLSPRMKASILELNRTLKTWPQLASSVALGGSVTTNLVRKIFLNQHTVSGRWRIDLDQSLTYEKKEAVFNSSTKNPIQTLDTNSSIETNGNFTPSLKKSSWISQCAESSVIPVQGKVHAVLGDNDILLFTKNLNVDSPESAAANHIDQIALGFASDSYSNISKRLNVSTTAQLEADNNGTHTVKLTEAIENQELTDVENVGQSVATGLGRINMKNPNALQMPDGVNIRTRKNAKDLNALIEILSDAYRMMYLLNISAHHSNGASSKQHNTLLPNSHDIIFGLSSEPSVKDLLRSWHGGSVFKDIGRAKYTAQKQLSFITVKKRIHDTLYHAGQAASRWFQNSSTQNIELSFESDFSQLFSLAEMFPELFSREEIEQVSLMKSGLHRLLNLPPGEEPVLLILENSTTIQQSRIVFSYSKNTSRAISIETDDPN